MVEVLAAVPQAGLEAVLVVVEVVLESVEHVRNVLAQLTTPAAQEQAETTLQLSEPQQPHFASAAVFADIAKQPTPANRGIPQWERSITPRSAWRSTPCLTLS